MAEQVKPNYVATKSAWKAVTFWRVIFFWLIIPLIVMIVDLIICKNERIEFYDDKVVVKSGVLSKKERKSVFTGVLSVSVEQSLWGRLFHYGNVNVDVMGKWDVNLEGVYKPKELEAYLETKIVHKSAFTNILKD